MHKNQVMCRTSELDGGWTPQDGGWTRRRSGSGRPLPLHCQLILHPAETITNYKNIPHLFIYHINNSGLGSVGVFLPSSRRQQSIDEENGSTPEGQE